MTPMSPVDPCRVRCRRRRALTLTDVCVALAAVAVFGLVAVGPVRQRATEADHRVRCARNLQQIAFAALMYAGETPRNNGKLPRVRYDFDDAAKLTWYTGANSPKAFNLPDSPRANDVTAGLFLLLKTQRVKADAFVCPSTKATPLKGDPAGMSNFPGPQHLSYSYGACYPLRAALNSGWKFDSTMSPEDPVAADMNPGDTAAGGPSKVAPAAAAKDMRAANSPNHQGDGQQVAYVDAHVEWHRTPFAGNPGRDRGWRDNIYTSGTGVDPKTGRGGDVHGRPAAWGDIVLLPTVADKAPDDKPAAGGQPAAATKPTPGR